MDPLTRVTDATLDVLEALMGPDHELYGYKIAQRAARKSGVVHPILNRLEEAGWIESRWESDQQAATGPRRRFYSLSPDGLSSARALLLQRRGAVRQRADDPTRSPTVPVMTTVQGHRS